MSETLSEATTPGAHRVAVLSNNPDTAEQLSGHGISVMERGTTGVHVSLANARYLAAKVARPAHTLDLSLAG
jgi:GTP cyclohydrolase II